MKDENLKPEDTRTPQQKRLDDRIASIDRRIKSVDQSIAMIDAYLIVCAVVIIGALIFIFLI
jgi:hypothetical protein